MTLHIRELAVELDADEEDVPMVIAGLVEGMERRLAEEAAMGRVGGFSVHVVRDVAREEVSA